MSNLQNPIFTDETKAREWLEARVCTKGPGWPHCGNADQDKITGLKGKAHHPRLEQSGEFPQPVTVDLKTTFYLGQSAPADRQGCWVKNRWQGIHQPRDRRPQQG